MTGFNICSVVTVVKCQSPQSRVMTVEEDKSLTRGMSVWSVWKLMQRDNEFGSVAHPLKWPLVRSHFWKSLGVRTCRYVFTVHRLNLPAEDKKFTGSFELRDASLETKTGEISPTQQTLHTKLFPLSYRPHRPYPHLTHPPTHHHHQQQQKRLLQGLDYFLV